MHRDLVLVFTSPDRPGIVERITSTVVEFGGNWVESRLTRLCGDFAGLAHVTVAVEQESALTLALEGLQTDELVIHIKPARDLGSQGNCHAVQLVLTGADHEGIVNKVASHLAKMGVNVEAMETSISHASTSGIPLFTMRSELRVPPEYALDSLKSDMRDVADQLGVDIELRPS